MQTGNAEQPRLGMSKGGHIQCMAEGGLVEKLKAGVNRLVGNNPDAMKQRGRDPDAVDAPPPAPEAKAPKIDFFKKATGGKIPKPPKGQPKHPEATGTDTVPIMGTPGEFMVKKAAVDKLGVDFMEKINSVADGDKPKLGKVKRKRRGKRKPMADGGLVVDEGGRPLRLPAPTPGTAVATTPYRPNFTIPPQQPPAAPLALPAPALPQAEVQRQPWQGRGASPEATAWQASRAPQAAPTAAAPAAPAPAPAAAPPTQLGRVARVASRAAAPAGAALAAVPEVLDTAQVAMNPNATGIDVGTQAAQGAARIAGAGLGAATGAGLGALTGPAAPIAVPLGALAGGAYGYYAADKAIEGGRTMAGTDPAAPAARLGEVARPATVPASTVPVRTATGAGAGQQTAGFNDPRNLTQDPSRASLGASRDFTNELAAVPAQLPAGLRLGVINKTQGKNGTTVYSGKDVGPGAMMVDGKGATTVSRGTVNSIDTSAGYAQDQRDLAAGTGGGGQALADARRAAVARGDIDAVKASYGGNFGPKVDPVDALVNNGRPMTARKAAAIAQLIAARDQSAVANKRLGIEQETADLTNREKKGLLSAQDAYANAKTPAEKAAAEDRLRALQGKYEKAPPDEYAAVAGGVDANGNRTDPLIYSKRTGEIFQQPGQQAQALPPKDKLVKGQRYNTPRGAAVWDGSKFVAG